MPSLSTIGETSVLQAPAESRGPRSARAIDARAQFRSGTPGRRAQDMRAPIFDLKADDRQTPRDPQPLESGRTPGSGAVRGAAAAPRETIAAAAGLRSLVPAGYADRDPLRRLSVNDAYLSAETLDIPYAHRGSIFDLNI